MSKSFQSCGIPMKKDPQRGGRNTDGTVNTEYCSLCFENGKFIHKNFTVKDVQKFCIEEITNVAYQNSLLCSILEASPDYIAGKQIESNKPHKLEYI